ncbi:putative LppA-like lipoprotein [Rhodococcus sp. AG1013]|uniref:LppA family lipoprotein n=1 Tax=Rhodococcus sp. AG1013 TaxID=2183996 RepID=UPI000E2BE1FC|nr:LppA family lipoprotein [Rhodococcus sp. AG1013]RDI28097.1 putative LppA-like lipoprotein [Rhodococcus sp. AG1013]
MNRHTLPLLAAIATTVTILTTGCGDLDTMGNPYNHTDEEIAAAAALLPTRPSLEDTEKQITDAVVQIANAATTIAPELQWEWRRQRTQSSCGGAFGKTDGLEIDLPNYVSATPIPDADWPRVLQAARDIAAPLGITQLNVRVDKPGDHDVVLTSDDGSQIHLGTQVAALVSARTGCRLPAQRTEQTP